jgi:cytochrome c oxidase cbb3-type subunit III
MKMKCAIIFFFALGALTAGCYVGARDEKETRYPKDPAPISASESKTAQEIAEANLKESAANSYVTTAIASRDARTPRDLNQVDEASVSGNAATGSPALVQLNEAEMYKDPTLIYREGRALFQNNCVGCHGHNGCGNVPRSTNFTDPGWQDNNSDNGIYSSIYNGKGIGNGGGAMPAYYNQLSPQQITYLISYLRAFRGRECNGLPTQADVERMTAARQNKR